MSIFQLTTKKTPHNSLSFHFSFPLSLSLYSSIGLTLSCYAFSALHAVDMDHSTMDHNSMGHHHHGLGLHSFAPAGIMGDHLHATGEWMFSYRFMRMSMDGLLDGSDSVSSAQALNPTGSYQYMAVPEEMTMDMHMLGAMYALNDRITFSLMLPYLDNSMSIRRRMGTPISFNTNSSGLGDMKLGALFYLASNEHHHLHANFTISLPTGSIDEKDDTPLGTNTHLPFPMQLGSGTFDFLPGITYLGQTDNNLHWGAQSILTLRSGTNDNDYSLGNRLEANAWISYVFTSDISISTRLSYNNWGNIDGDDSEQNPMMKNMNPNADPQLRGGQRLDLGFGIDLNESLLKGHRLGLEVLTPIQQNLDGPQMEMDVITNLTWQYAF